MKLMSEPLRRLVAAIFQAGGCKETEAQTVARRLVDSNLVGHDSHGVMRVSTYIQWLREGKVVANQEPKVLLDTPTLALLDGQLGFGQVMGEVAMQMGIDKAKANGISAIALRNSAHMGRIGDWVIMAAEANMIAICFVNTSGLGLLTAPFGGIDRRLSANPFAVGIPMEGRPPFVLDISGSSIAEGKIRVALHKGVQVPEGCLIDNQGLPTTDPKIFYGDANNAPGAILPFGGHKGFGISLITEILAGAVTTGGCSKPGIDRLEQGMLAIVLDPARFQSFADYSSDVREFADFVKSSRTVTPGGEILMPGEPEERTKATRLKAGIELPDTTWQQIQDTAATVGIGSDKIASLVG